MTQKKLSLAVLLGFVLATSPAARAAASCNLPEGRVVASGAVAKLIALPTPNGSALFACIRRTGRKVPLDDGFKDAVIAGRWVAWQRPGRRGNWRIDVHDLRTGKERLVDGHVAARSLHVTVRGSIVWAQLQDPGADTPLYANELRTGGRLLDPGPVDATSVRVAGRRVTWFTTDDVMHSALVR